MSVVLTILGEKYSCTSRAFITKRRIWGRQVSKGQAACVVMAPATVFSVIILGPSQLPSVFFLLLIIE